MGQVVAFDQRMASMRHRSPSRECEIVIFPGVRYERHADYRLSLSTTETDEGPDEKGQEPRH